MGAYTCFLAGLEHRPKTATTTLRGMPVNTLLQLEREPHNTHDPSAVSVWFNGEKLGYVPMRHSSWIAERIDCGRFLEIYLSRFQPPGIFGSGAETELLVATLPTDAPEGTETARKAADELAALQVMWAERKEDQHIRPAITDSAAILLWIGAVGDTLPEKRWAIIDDMISAELLVRGWPTSPERINRLRSKAQSLKGTQQRAMKALRAIANDRDLLARLMPNVLAMVQADGIVTQAEKAAVSQLIDEARAILASLQS